MISFCWWPFSNSYTNEVWNELHGEPGLSRSFDKNKKLLETGCFFVVVVVVVVFYAPYKVNASWSVKISLSTLIESMIDSYDE